MRKLLVIVLLLIVGSLNAQESNKKRVLVVPYDRFQLESEFDLAEIAKKNDSKASKVFLIYQKAFLESFINYEDENFEFVVVQHDLLQPYKSMINYQSGKFRGKRYNAVNLKEMNDTDFTKLLEAHGADFVVFLTWHDIQKESFVRNGEHRKRVPYAGHYLDYDVFNLFKQRVIGEGRVKANGKEPNDAEADFALLRTKELKTAYAAFIAYIIERLNNPIQ